MKKLSSLSFFDTAGLDAGQLPTPGWQNRIHANAYILIALVFGLATALGIFQGEIKSWAEIDWVDVAGEGSLTVATLVWLYFIHAWRPPGPVTTSLTLGFALLSFSFYLDTLDEVIRLEHTWMGSSLESEVSPLAIIMITVGILNLSREQKVFGRQQRRREAHYRNHRDIDPVTDLYNGEYCRRALAAALSESRAISLCLIDLDDFNSINQRYGFSIGDAVLNRVANTLVAAAPSQSLVCRYGGDRFALLVHGHQPISELEVRLNTLLTEAVGLALLLETGEQPPIAVQAVQLIAEPGETAEVLMQRAALEVQARKRKAKAVCAADGGTLS